ncbi:MAG TPA: hypothetical protein VNC80_13035, partial [Mycobacteriales bacterium]|nr:hypothetical protein [Mycobacteriales bacterium]
MTEQDLRDAFDRMVAAGPPPTGGTADVLAAVRQARRRRSLLTIAGAAVAAVAVLIAGSVLLGPSSAGPTAVRPTPTAPAPPTVPGVSPAEAKAVVARCLAQYRGKEWTPAARARLQLYNMGPTPWGTRYLFYGPTEYLDCLHATEGDYRPDGSVGQQTQWLRGPVSIDRAIADGQPYDRGPGTFTVEGRVSASVAKVEITYGASKLDVPVRNGTFMAAMTITAQEVLKASASFRALDATGKV